MVTDPLMQNCHLCPDTSQRVNHSVIGLDRVTDRVDPCAVLRLELAGFLTEGARDVAGRPRERSQPGYGVLEFLAWGGSRIRLDEAASQHFAAAGNVDGSDPDAAALELLCDPGRPGEQIARGAHAHGGRDGCEHRDQRAVAAQVLEHLGHSDLPGKASRGYGLPSPRYVHPASRQAAASTQLRPSIRICPRVNAAVD